MATLSKMTCWATALLAAVATAQPHGHIHHRHQHRSTTCDFGIPDPPGCPAGVLSQWCGMITTEVSGLKTSENPVAMIPNIEAIYKQANIKADPSSALADPETIMQYPQARAAMERMKASYPTTGSPDLTPEDIQNVYADALNAACNKTGVPEDILIKIIWTESKGHPLVYNGLTQMDYVAWGQMADENPDLKNRYEPTSNIVAAAMYLAKQKGQFGGTWDETYYNHYQDPSLPDA
ncbi:hypothetical protein M409DRAFT_21319 [Zasmidium cellare ATCC 36951]|uniref:Transglycosylase SLT domain-containing protein n=1 Tax=Zasmidium cellare ATCC 36951 TaxID=1080233 RepID=A0A6A6CS29_ZASCE|nr:uncharacterized protein M409DRAFT_21319 [Zasmidium cellare ATCC 36951]KAF2168569.1 hypothetical protein M409DRAFT_21319 [Zasmidium cellare ATCC 36951]